MRKKTNRRSYSRSIGGKFVSGSGTDESHEISNPEIDEIPDISAPLDDNQTVINDKITWADGRRIVSLKCLADRLDYCINPVCDSKLNLKNIISETRSGFGSYLVIECSCGTYNQVATDTTHHKNANGRAIFDINTKVAGAMVHTGTSQLSLIRFMNSIEVPAADAKTLRLREQEAGKYIQQVAEESCKEALQEEATITPDIVASFDGAWQCRASSGTYNSKSGHAVLIGQENGKILGYGIRNRNCRKCIVNPDKSHLCQRNWGGSAKAMEADLAVELINKSNGQNHKIKAIIADEDCSTMAKVKQLVPHHVEK